MRFAIVGHHRSGTTSLLFALGDALNRKFFNEPFNTDAYKWGNDLEYQDLSKVHHDCFMKTLLRYNHPFDLNKLKDSIKNVNKLFIYRKNVFDVAISLYTALETKCWNSFDIKKHTNYKLFFSEHSIDQAKFRHHYNMSKSMIRELKDYSNESDGLFNRIITFEDLYEGDISESTFRKIEAVIGEKMDKSRFISGLESNNSKTPELSKYYKNYSEIYQKYGNNI